MSDYLTQVRAIKRKHNEDVKQSFVTGLVVGILGAGIIAGGAVVLGFILP